MNESSFKKLVREILEESLPSPEHERLKEDLTAWANAYGYTKPYPKLPNGSEPDVLRTGENDFHSYLFVGDAKNSENETVDNSETVSRIQTYFHQFGRLLSKYEGGCLAIATNSVEEARRWVPVLNILARAAKLTSGVPTPPDFRVVQIPGKNTWVTYW
jgi:hypothetical protein